MTLSVSGCRRPSWAIISCVIPSLKYSCSGSPERFSKGRTASRMAAGAAAAWPRIRLRIPPTLRPKSIAKMTSGAAKT